MKKCDKCGTKISKSWWRRRGWMEISNNPDNTGISHSPERCLEKRLESANLQAESWCIQATESDLKLKEMTIRCERAENIITAIRNEYSRESGLLDVPALCRRMPYSGCFCGCHISTTMNSD